MAQTVVKIGKAYKMEREWVFEGVLIAEYSIKRNSKFCSSEFRFNNIKA